MPYLALTSGTDPARSVELFDGLCIGREPQCDLTLTDTQVSRQHLRFSNEAGAWVLTDLGSRHGVFVNAQRVTKHILEDGDQIQVGHTVLVFHREGTPSEVLREIVTEEEPNAPSGANARLRLFYDLAGAMGELGDTDALLEKLLSGIIEVLSAERGAVALCGHGALQVVARGRGGRAPKLAIAREVQSAVLSRKSAVIVQEPSRSDTMARQHVRSAMAAPLLWNGRILGLLYVDDLGRPARFGEADLDFLAALGRVCAAALDGAHQFQSAVAAAEVARREPRRLLGQSALMRALRETLHKVAAASAHVVIHGETGTGKELVAREIHLLSARSAQPFVAINCAALPEGLVESELFGHRRGAFPGAQDHAGVFVRADGGTLFLDEIAELSLAAQAKVLRAIAEGEVLPLKASRATHVDVRVVAASHKDLLQEVRAGRFREDLYYRLRVVDVTVPPLRERGDDILLLAREFLAWEAKRYPKALVGFSEDAEEALMAHCWPGNVRELRNEVERAVILAGGPMVELRDLSSQVRGAGLALGASLADVPFELELQELPGRGRREEVPEPVPSSDETAPPSEAAAFGAGAGAQVTSYGEAVDAFRRRYFRELYELMQGNVSAMARLAGLKRHHVRAYLTKFGIP